MGFLVAGCIQPILSRMLEEVSMLSQCEVRPAPAVRLSDHARTCLTTWKRVNCSMTSSGKVLLRGCMVQVIRFISVYPHRKR